MKSAPQLIRLAITATIVAAAVVAGVFLWEFYMDSPWTRDGRVRANVVEIAPDVAGFVVDLDVHDNQQVAKGDVLFTIDPARYQVALDRAQANVAALKEQMDQRRREANRREQLGSSAITGEAREQAASAATTAEAAYQQALADLEAAKLNLERTTVRAPVNGYVTNLNLTVGAYLTAGKAAFALVDSDSYYVVGYFEETKIARIHEGDTVSIRLMGFDVPVEGKVLGIARAIVDREAADGSGMLANVNPTFSWVRLAQRIPVRIQIGALPDHVRLSAGMTATVVVQERPSAQ